MFKLSDVLFWLFLLVVFGGQDLLNVIQAVKGDYPNAQQEQKESPKKKEDPNEIKSDW